MANLIPVQFIRFRTKSAHSESYPNQSRPGAVSPHISHFKTSPGIHPLLQILHSHPGQCRNQATDTGGHKADTMPAHLFNIHNEHQCQPSEHNQMHHLIQPGKDRHIHIPHRPRRQSEPKYKPQSKTRSQERRPAPNPLHQPPPLSTKKLNNHHPIKPKANKKKNSQSPQSPRAQESKR